MLGARGYKTKKDLKAAIGKPLRFEETSMFGFEYKDTGEFCIVGPDAHRARNWYATVTMVNGIIAKVK